MNRATLQAFSAGIIFSTAIFAGFYYGNDLNKEVNFSKADAKKMLENQGYSVSKATVETESAEKKAKAVPLAEPKNTREALEKKNSEKQEENISYILKVKNKMTTGEIVTELEKEKIIDDATKFQNYMNEHNLSRRVQIGEYIVTNSMNYEELGKLLTNNK